MIVIQAHKLSKSFADQIIFKDIQFTLKLREKVGLVGANGSGKSTFLNCICEKIKPDQGEISMAKHVSWGYLEQLPAHRDGCTVWDIVMEGFTALIEQRNALSSLEEKISQGGAELEKWMEQYVRITEEYERNEGYACENIARRILHGLGFTPAEFFKLFCHLSGGQKTRLNLARLLALNPDVLVLDEPTNHLDITALEWLEGFLQNYGGTLLLVSHDRRFLDQVCTRIVEMRNHQLFSYSGNYTNFLKLKARQELSWARAYEKQQEYIKRTEDYIRKYKAGIKARQARGRQLQLQRLDKVEKPVSDPGHKKWDIDISQTSGEKVLTLRGIYKGFDGKPLLRELDLDIVKGEKIALIGPNGVGKTTLLKIIQGILLPEKGGIRWGSHVKMAYFSQGYEKMDPEKTLLEEIMFGETINRTGEARTMLGRMLFTGDDVFKKVKNISGGEKSRLQLLKVILSGANFLVLDEPSNHLDLESILVLEEMLEHYQGTVLIVSHDRYFMDRLVERTLSIEDGRLVNYLGNYSYYREKRKQEEEKKALLHPGVKSKPGNWKTLDPIKEKEKEKNKIEHKLEKMEAEIGLLEKEKEQLEQLLAKNYTHEKREPLYQYTEALHQLTGELALKYQEWEETAESLSSWEEQKTEG